jgi:hypothetical protein
MWFVEISGSKLEVWAQCDETDANHAHTNDRFKAKHLIHSAKLIRGEAQSPFKLSDLHYRELNDRKAPSSTH